MKNLINIFCLLILFSVTSNCGYKVLDNADYKDFSFNTINTTGDKRINFRIKNDLIVDSSENKKNRLIMNLETKKIKTIKEKNIKNEITKYEISLIANVNLNFLDDDLVKQFMVKTTGDFTVDSKYSTTLKNEKRLIEDLTDNLSNKIKNKINLILNDL